MHDNGIRYVPHAKSAVNDPRTEIGLFEVHEIVGVESADLLKQVPAHSESGSVCRLDILFPSRIKTVLKHPGQSGKTGPVEPEKLAEDTPKSWNEDCRRLVRAVRVLESGSHGSNTGVAIDPSGNVWLTNNWKPTPLINNPGGNSIAVLIGAAAPIRTPLIGTPESFERPRGHGARFHSH